MTADRIASLVRTLAKVCDSKGYTLVTAESCTGGGLAAAITDLAGVSSFFLGGVVSYSNEIKMELLGVPASILETEGAVSESTARAMASGVRERLGADIGVGITGIAGPGGDTPTKPVGLVHIAVATPDTTAARRDVWPGDRAAVRQASIQAALDLILGAIATT